MSEISEQLEDLAVRLLEEGKISDEEEQVMQQCATYVQWHHSDCPQRDAEF